MVRKKEAASKSRAFHAIEPESSIPSEVEEERAPVVQVEAKRVPVLDEKHESEKLSSEDELPTLPKEREPNQPAITSFFAKTPIKSMNKGKKKEEISVASPKKKAYTMKETKAAQVEKMGVEDEEASTDEEHTPLLLRKSAISKEKEVQKSWQHEEHFTQKKEAVISGQKPFKRQATKKLPPRKSTRGSAPKDQAYPMIEETKEMEQQLSEKQKESGQVQKKAVEKGKRKMEAVKPSQETSLEGACEKLAAKELKAAEKENQVSSPAKPRLKKAKAADTTPHEQDQDEEAATKVPSITKKQRKSKLEQLDVSVSYSPGTRLRKRRIEEASPSVPTGESNAKEAKEAAAEASIPTRKKMVARKTKTPKELPKTSSYYPFISEEAKTAFEEIMKNKTTIRERALAWNSPNANPDIKEII